MARLVVLYKTPKDTSAFDTYYFQTHVPLAKAIPGLRKFEVSHGSVSSPGGSSNVHLVAILHFDDMAALGAGLASPEGRAAAADVQTFASGGVEMLMFDDRQV